MMIQMMIFAMRTSNCEKYLSGLVQVRYGDMVHGFGAQ